MLGGAVCANRWEYINVSLCLCAQVDIVITLAYTLYNTRGFQTRSYAGDSGYKQQREGEQQQQQHQSDGATASTWPAAGLVLHLNV